MIEHKLNSIIREIPDFPKKGIKFKDITSLLLDYNLCENVLNHLVAKISDLKIDAVVGVESRGFLFGFALANKLKVPFIPVRKSGKLPGETISYKYDLEYGSSELEIHKNDLKKDWNVLIHDDLLATGGTAVATSELIKKSGAQVSGFIFIVKLDYLKGEGKLRKYSKNILGILNCKN